MDYSGMKALVMGLGLHGGGLESARFMLRRGAVVTVTDTKDEKALAPSIEQLEAACREAGQGVSVRYVLGRHEAEDFRNADIVIKNPGVRPDSPWLQLAKRIETDISLFLAASPARLFAITGTKGKSTAASALHWILTKARESKAGFAGKTGFVNKAWLGGNITVSPLSFLEELTADDDVVLELSSWQLGDLKGRTAPNGGPLLKPRAAVLTAIMPDHLDRYASMEAYTADKRIIYSGQDRDCVTIAGDDEWGRSFLSETRGRSLVYARAPLPEGQSGGWLADPEGPGLARLYGDDWPGFDSRRSTGETVELVPSRLRTPGTHQKQNLLAAALAAYGLGVEAEIIRNALASFPGIEHRLEFFHEAGGIRFYNDSAATIPEAAAAAVQALSPGAPLALVTGGNDKNLDFSVLAEAASEARAIILLAGSGSEKLKVLLDEAGINYRGPFDDLDKAVNTALEIARSETARGGCGIVALSPGCTGFGMFQNEFDRGRKWKDAVMRLA